MASHSLHEWAGARAIFVALVLLAVATPAHAAPPTGDEVVSVAAAESDWLGSQHAAEHVAAARVARLEAAREAALTPAARTREARVLRALDAQTGGPPSLVGRWTHAPFRIPT